MDAQNLQRLETLFHALLEIPPSGREQAALQLSGGDADLALRALPALRGSTGRRPEKQVDLFRLEGLGAGTSYLALQRFDHRIAAITLNNRKLELYRKVGPSVLAGRAAMTDTSG